MNKKEGERIKKFCFGGMETGAVNTEAVSMCPEGTEMEGATRSHSGRWGQWNPIH